MATRQMRELSNRGNHEVGNLSAMKINTLPYGAKCEEDIDNFLLVELDFDADGQRICRTLTDVTKEAYLIASPEERKLGNIVVEEMVDFFNGVGEFARIVYLEKGKRHESSAFVLNTGVPAVKNGLVAHYDPASKKYIISDAGHMHADYATASVKFLIVASEGDTEYSICGKPIVRLEVK